MKRLAAIGLLVLAPVCAEYVVGYDTSTGDLVELFGGLLVLGPLYGGAAILIREAARRLRLGWVGILFGATAFGVLQAGLIDQSMFNDNYRDIDYWAAIREPTLLPGLGVSGNLTLSFVSGHVINSIALPILIMEAVTVPRLRRTPWLGRPGLVVVAVLFAMAGWLVLDDTLKTETFRMSTGQLIGAVVTVVVLMVAAVVVGLAVRRRRIGLGPVPPWWVIGLMAFVAGIAVGQFPSVWWGVGCSAGVMIVVGALLTSWSGRATWSDRHRAALSAGLVSLALVGFEVVPIRSVQSDVAVLAHHLIMTSGLLVLVLLAVRRSAPVPVEPVPVEPVPVEPVPVEPVPVEPVEVTKAGSDCRPVRSPRPARSVPGH